MLAGLAFLSFGFLGGLAYLAYHAERELVAYGLAMLGIASALWGVELLISGDGSAAQSLATLVAVLRFIAMGGGLAFLAFTGAIEARAWWKEYAARKEAELQAIREGLRLESRKDAQPARSAAPR